MGDREDTPRRGREKDLQQVFLIRRLAAIAIAVLALFACCLVGRWTWSGVVSFREQLAAKPEPEPKVQRLKPKPKPKPKVVVAWQPSHQDDTGDGEWHEYKMAGEIVDAAMSAATKVKSVKAWDISNGLSGSNSYSPEPSNVQSFDKELAIANGAKATYFISVHIGDTGESGVEGFYMPGDSTSKMLAQRLVIAVASKTQLPSKGVSESRLYSLDPGKNRAKNRVLIELGGTSEDRRYLQDPANVKVIGAALAEVFNGLAP